MNKKLLIALGILIVLIIGLVCINYVDYHRIIGEGIVKQLGEQFVGTDTVKFGENTGIIRTESATYLGYYNGKYNVRFKGYIYLYVDEPMAWKAGFNILGSKTYITTCNPGFGKYYTYDRGVYCAYSYWWRACALRIDGQLGAEGTTKSWGVNDIPCQ